MAVPAGAAAFKSLAEAGRDGNSYADRSARRHLAGDRSPIGCEVIISMFVPGLLQGAKLTLEIALLGGILAVAAATVAALAKMYGSAPLRWLAVSYIEIFRGTSALVQLFWLFFVLPHFGITLEPFTVAVIGLGLNVGAYGDEDYAAELLLQSPRASGKRQPRLT